MKKEETAPSSYDSKGNAAHYDGRINMSRMIEKIWGTENFMIFCEITAFKYKMRMGKKDATELEITKIRWYETMAKWLKFKLEKGSVVGAPQEGFSNMDVHYLEDGFLKMLGNEDLP